jgi:hypothetical protein
LTGEFILIENKRPSAKLAKTIHTTQRVETERWNAIQFLDDRGVARYKSIFGDMKSTSPLTIIVPDILCSNYHSMLRHLNDFVTSLVEHKSSIDIFNQLQVMMYSYPDFT